jgi:hypothetical protein
MSRLVALYPRTWRDRYEDEFLALLSERPPNPVDRLDIIRGAVDARLHPQVPGTPAESEPPVDRGPWPVRAGWLTLLGGALWIAALVVAINSPIVTYESYRDLASMVAYRDTAASMPLFFAAITLLGVGMIALTLQLPETARAARAACYLSSMAGLLWAFAPWLLPSGLIAFPGLLVVAFAAWRVGRWSSMELGILVTGVGLGWGLLLTGASGLWGPPTPNPDLQFFVVVPLVSAWVVVGASLVRVTRRVASLDPPDA